MKKRDRNYIYFCLFFMAVSGIGVEVLDEFFKVETDFGVRSNPWIEEVKFIHNLFNFAFVFCVGKIFNSHIALGLKNIKKERRLTGILSFICINCLVLSGIILLYTGNEEVIEITELIHWYLGLTLIVSFFTHQCWPLLLSRLKPNKRISD